LAICVLGAACNSTAVNKDASSTLLNSDDMVAMTNKMAQSIISDARVHAAWAIGPLKIVIKPATNLTNDIIPDTHLELFVARLQGLLASQQSLADRFVWCINRSDYQKLRAQEIPEAKLGLSEDRIQPEYALYAEFHSDTQVTRRTRSDTYLCVYKLTRISGGSEGAVLWEGTYETSKNVNKGFLD
jgi:hypothetical protein